VFLPDGTKQGPFNMAEVMNGVGTGAYFYDYAVGGMEGEYLFIADSAACPLKSIRQVTFNDAGLITTDDFRVYYVAKDFQTGLPDVKLTVYKPDFTKDAALPMTEMVDPISAGVYYHDYYIGAQEGEYLFIADSNTLPFRAMKQATFCDPSGTIGCQIATIKGDGFNIANDSLHQISQREIEIRDRLFGQDGGAGTRHIELIVKDSLGNIEEGKEVRIYRKRDFALIASDISADVTGQVEFDLDPEIYLVAVVGSQVFDKKAYETLIVN
jgi:hypothetical protein